MALSKSNLWNFLISLNVFGKSASSAFSSLYHFFHYKESVSKLEHKLANSGIVSKALAEAQIYSVIKFFKTSGIGPGLGSTLPIIK